MAGVTTLEHVAPSRVAEGAAAAHAPFGSLRTRRVWRTRGQLLRRTLVAADVGSIVFALAAATVLLRGSESPSDVLVSAETLLLLITIPLWLAAAKLRGLYDRDEERVEHSTVDDVGGVCQVVTIGLWASVLAANVVGVGGTEVWKLTVSWFIAVAAMTSARAAARAACRRSPAYLQNTIIVGAGEIGQLVARKLGNHPEYGLNLVGFVDSAPKDRRSDLDSLTVLGGAEELRGIVERYQVERVVVAFSNESAEATRDLIRDLNDLDIHVDVVPRLFEVVGPKVDVHAVEGLALVGLSHARTSPAARVLKRSIDVLGSSLALALAAPLMAYIAWRIRRDSPGPVFFKQTRLGLNAREFTALKFRSMKVDTDPEEHRRYVRDTAGSAVATEGNGLFKLERNDAVTPFGRWLRKTSLDELPQLINVFRGDMSLVGPRPCIPYETENFETHHFERFDVPAGITGLWQVTARANSTFREALEMDVAYARCSSLGLDLRLLIRTPLQLLRQRGATA